MIKLEALRVFITVAEFGNIKDAATRIDRTASAVSMTLKRLEDEIGGALFESDRKSSLTPLGEFVLETAIPQITSFDRALESISAYTDHKVGRLLLACVPSVAANLIAPIFSAFLENRPGLTLELFDSDSDNVARMVEIGDADIGIAGAPASHRNISFTPLFRDRYMLVCSTNSPLAKIQRPIEPADIDPNSLIQNGALRRIEAPEFRAFGLMAPLNVRNVTSLLALVKFGRGVTLLPALACNNLPEGVKALELADTRFSRLAGIIERNGVTSSPVAAAFRKSLIEIMPELGRELKLEVLTPAHTQ